MSKKRSTRTNGRTTKPEQRTHSKEERRPLADLLCTYIGLSIDLVMLLSELQSEAASLGLEKPETEALSLGEYRIQLDVDKARIQRTIWSMPVATALDWHGPNCSLNSCLVY